MEIVVSFYSEYNVKEKNVLKAVDELKSVGLDVSGEIQCSQVRLLTACQLIFTWSL